MEGKTKNRYIDNNGVMWDTEGNKQLMLDFVATNENIPGTNVPFVKRYYDYNTKNKSFINIHVLLKKAGIKNHSEHLQIFDPSLIGVDPRSTTLTDVEKAKILNEIRINPWYYAREVVTVGKDNDPFRLDIAAFYALFLMMRCINTLEELPRQTGKTVALTTFIGWIFIFGTRNTNMGNIHYNKKESNKNMKQIIEVLDKLPDYLQLHKKELKYKVTKQHGETLTIKDKALSAATIEWVKCDIYNNEIKSFIVGKDEQSAANVGRGSTTAIWMIDEIAFIKYNDIAFRAFSPAYGTAAINAKKAGHIYGIWMLTTPGDLKQDHGKWVFNKINSEYMKFDYSHFKIADMTREELEKYISKFSSSGVVYIKLNHNMLGYGKNWMYERSKMLDTRGIRSEIMLKWEVHTTASPFSAAVLSNLETRTGVSDNYAKIIRLDDEDNELILYPRKNQVAESLELYMMQFKRSGLVLGIDVSFGSGGDSDSSTIVAVDPTTLQVAFVYKRNDISIDQLAILLIRLVDQYFEELSIPVALAIERNAGGKVLIDLLKRYERFSKYLVVYPMSEARASDPTRIVDYTFSYNGNTTKFDVGLTVNTNRSQLINILITLVTKHTEAVAVRAVTEEVKTLVRKKTITGQERIEHAEGRHDDVLFGLTHAMHAIFFNAELLKLRNGISVNPDTFMINDGALSINTTGVLNNRISMIYESISGKLIDRYYDNSTGRYLDKETALKIDAEEKARKALLSSNKDSGIQLEPEKKYNKSEIRLQESSADNVVINSKSAHDPITQQSQDWDTWLDSII